MRKAFQILFAITVFVSCGPKPSTAIPVFTKETNAYISNVDVNSSLKEETIEGALTDTEGFKDIGKFKYTIYFDEQTNELFKIKNVEMTDQTISEIYYFNSGDLVRIDTHREGVFNKMYVQKGKVVSETKTDPTTQKLLLEKAKRFEKAFKKAH